MGAPARSATRRAAPRPAPAGPAAAVRIHGQDGGRRRYVRVPRHQDRNYVARVGDTMDGTYRVDSIDDNGVVVTYLPLKQKQTLAFGEAAHGRRRAAEAPAAGREARRRRCRRLMDED